jgi:hypothetical protein
MWWSVSPESPLSLYGGLVCVLCNSEVMWTTVFWTALFFMNFYDSTLNTLQVRMFMFTCESFNRRYYPEPLEGSALILKVQCSHFYFTIQSILDNN